MNLEIQDIRRLRELLTTLHNINLNTTSTKLKEEAKNTYNNFASYLENSANLD